MEFGEGALFANILKTCVFYLSFSRSYMGAPLLLDYEPMTRFGYQVEKSTNLPRSWTSINRSAESLAVLPRLSSI
jgi:hypothetical protein